MFKNKIIIILILIITLVASGCSLTTTSQINGINKEMYKDMYDMYDMLYNKVANLDLDDTDRMKKEMDKFIIIMTKYDPKNIKLTKEETSLYNDIMELSNYQWRYAIAVGLNETDNKEKYLNEFMKKYNELKGFFEN